MNNEILQQIINTISTSLEIYSYTAIGKALLKNRNPIVSAEYQPNQKQFPYITITQQDNSYKDSTMEKIETETNLVFEISIYDNKSNKINVTLTLGTIINEIMTNLGFRRNFNSPVPNIANAKVYRLVQRYNGSYNSEINKIYKF